MPRDVFSRRVPGQRVLVTGAGGGVALAIQPVDLALSVASGSLEAALTARPVC